MGESSFTWSGSVGMANHYWRIVDMGSVSFLRRSQLKRKRIVTAAIVTLMMGGIWTGFHFASADTNTPDMQLIINDTGDASNMDISCPNTLTQTSLDAATIGLYCAPDTCPNATDVTDTLACVTTTIPDTTTTVPTTIGP
jgi:hypothetical protein